jgi:hypothetical protein
VKTGACYTRLRLTPPSKCVDCRLPSACVQQRIYCTQRNMGGGHHQRGYSVGIARVDSLGARGEKQGGIALRLQRARTCGVMGGEEADAVFMVESGCKKHGSDGGGIHRRLHVVCRAVVEQSGNARRFSWVGASTASDHRLERDCIRKKSARRLPAAAARWSAVRPSASRAFATDRAQPPRASSRSTTASSRPAAAAACSGYLIRS